MSELFGQLGINLPMLVAQAVNFAILLVVLTIFVYKPLMKMVEERRKKIEFGLKGAEEVEIKLGEIEIKRAEILKEADKAGQEIVKRSELKAGERAGEIISDAQKKGDSILIEAEEITERKKREEMNNLTKEAKVLVRAVIEKTVELDPKLIDEKLINQAIDQLSKNY